MTAEQWKQVKLLYQQVLDLTPSQREVFLNENCNDSEVRKEIDSLLSNYQKAEEFLTPPNPEALKVVIPLPKAETKLVEDINSFYDSLIGRKLNNTYLVEEKLGEGGMGAVFRCTHLLLNDRVAIKVMSPSVTKNDNYRKRFHREARVGRLLDHPNIIKVFEFSQSQDGILFIVMEFVEGETLKSYIKKSAPIKLSKAIEIIKPVCNALDIAHKRKIIHRDLKPANILIGKQDEEEIIKLFDFGIIKLLEHNEEIAGNDVSLTKSSDIMGTVNYMSPEQITKAYELSPASDIYSLGLILYEMLTGELPIVGFTPEETLILKTKGKKILAPSTKFPFLPTAIDVVFQKTLSMFPTDRYQAVEELLNDLEAL
jgi:serine/threonine-protein kinase